jgi:hypothetical protein
MTPNPNKIPYEKDFTIAEAWLVLTTWRQSDTYPWMKRRTVNYIALRAAFFVSLIVLFVHCIWALQTHCGINFQRGGSIIALLAAGLYAVVDWHDPKTVFLSGGGMRPITFFDPYFMLPVLGALGTVVWGYGDLLPFFGICRV